MRDPQAAKLPIVVPVELVKSKQRVADHGEVFTPPEIVEEMLGHASAQMTLDRYAGLFDGHLDDVADRMDAAFAHMESDSEVTEPDSGVSLRIAGATNSIASQWVSDVAPR